MTAHYLLPGHIKACVFDFDGTLAPNLDLPDMRRQVIELTQGQGVPDAVFAQHYIVEIIDVAGKWLTQYNRTKAASYTRDAHQLIRRIELQAAHDTHPFSDTQPLLKQLRANNVSTIIVTRNCETAVRNIFPHVDEYCDALFARDNVEFLKPDPRHVQQALDHVGARAADAAMIGDGQMDMRLGHQLSMYCIGVLSGSGDAQALREAGADRVIDHIGKIQC